MTVDLSTDAEKVKTEAATSSAHPSTGTIFSAALLYDVAESTGSFCPSSLSSTDKERLRYFVILL